MLRLLFLEHPRSTSSAEFTLSETLKVHKLPPPHGKFLMAADYGWRGGRGRLPRVDLAVAAVDAVVGGLLDGLHHGQVLVLEGDNPARRKKIKKN